MNTSEVLDLSKENIQPLKQGRHAAKLGTALQAQTNAELQQKLLAEREQFELLIRMYEGDDPLKPHYDYVNWIEQSFPKHGPESNLVQILENTLTCFKDDDRYKQDIRYAELLIKYIDTQPNPLELYQLVYNQGLCTMCAPFYVAWAEELDKNNDLKNADQVFELGVRVKAQPIELLQEAQLRFQLSVGRRMLSRRSESAEDEADYQRQALHKIKKQNICTRDPVGAPGRIKQQVLSTRNNQNAPFKVYQGDDDCNIYSESQGKTFPKQDLVNKENTVKAGPWSQSGGKHRSRAHVPSSVTPPFQVHEDEGADVANGHHKTSSVPGALKTRKKDTFTCPLAVFEPPDPTKRPMYCKNKVYAGGREFQFEELRAAIYNRRYEQLAALKVEKELVDHLNSEDNASKDELMLLNKNKTAEGSKSETCKSDDNIAPVIQSMVAPGKQECGITNSVENDFINNKQDVFQEKDKPTCEQDIVHEDIKFAGEAQIVKAAFDTKAAPLEVNSSLSHCQSFTVNTKEAMNVVQEMWNSPSPAPVFGRNSKLARPYPSSPVCLDDSGVFKVPLPPPIEPKMTTVAPRATPKKTPSFPIYTDEESPAFTPSPAPVTVQHFQVYTDEAENDKKPLEIEPSVKPGHDEMPRKDENSGFPFHPFKTPAMAAPHTQGARCPPGTDAETIKMLAFQSDSDDEDVGPFRKRAESLNFKADQQAPIVNHPSIVITAPTPTGDKSKSTGGSFPSHPAFNDEDMTCNTKAFDFIPFSSTPLVGHAKPTGEQVDRNCNNGSYIVEDVKKSAPRQDLSMIFEASKERYSSSSGSSGSKTQGSVCTVGNNSAGGVLPPAQPELLEKLAQISANTSVIGELEKSLGLLNISGPIDPFSTDLISQLLAHIGYPKKHHLIGLHKFDTDTPVLHTNSTTKLGPAKYSVVGELGKGAYARVLKATKEGQPVALKQQRPAWEWEWYIVRELQSRLPPSCMDLYLHFGNGYIYKNASILESEWAQYGSVLSVVNKLKINSKGIDLNLALLFSIHLICIVENLHKCKIIHGDIKPDNFVLCSLPTTDLAKPCLKLIDFGRSIDMSLFPEGTTFSTVVTTDGFQCNEMKEGHPWTYQTDLYGLAGSIYCVLFYDYMKVVKKDKWQLTQKVPRYMMPIMWQEIFTPLLNVESCDKLPNLSVLKGILEKQYNSIEKSTVNQSIVKLTNILMNK